MLTTYRDVLSRPGAALFSLTAVVSRLPLSMAGFGIVLLVSERTGSYGRAGVAGRGVRPRGGGVRTDAGPARRPPRPGQGAVGRRRGLRVRDGADAGRDRPRMGDPAAAPVRRDRRSRHAADRQHGAGAVDPCVADRSQLNTAFSIEAVLDEVVFMVGPVLVTVLTLQVSDFAGLVCAAAAASLGSWALAAQRRTEPPRDRARRPAPVRRSAGACWARSSWRRSGSAMLFGSAEVIVVAFCTEEGNRGAAGFVIAIWATGSLIAGVVVGALPQPAEPLHRLRVVTARAVAAVRPAQLSCPGIPLIAVGMFLTGFMISPTLIAMVNLIEQHVPSSRLTEALTWMTTGARGRRRAGLRDRRLGHRSSRRIGRLPGPADRGSGRRGRRVEHPHTVAERRRGELRTDVALTLGST